MLIYFNFLSLTLLSKALGLHLRFMKKASMIHLGSMVLVLQTNTYHPTLYGWLLRYPTLELDIFLQSSHVTSLSLAFLVLPHLVLFSVPLKLLLGLRFIWLMIYNYTFIHERLHTWTNYIHVRFTIWNGIVNAQIHIALTNSHFINSMKKLLQNTKVHDIYATLPQDVLFLRTCVTIKQNIFLIEPISLYSLMTQADAY